MPLLDKRPRVFGDPGLVNPGTVRDSPRISRSREPSPVDRRASIRYPLRLPVLIVAAGGHSMSLTAHTCNISSTGVLLRCSEELAVEQTVEYVINLYPDYDLRLRCKGRVERSARVSTPPAPAGGAYALALTLETFEFARQGKGSSGR